MHKTLVVHNRFAWHSYRTNAAFDGEQGVLLLTIEQLAARLAGGFLQPINSDDLKKAVSSAITQKLGELDVIKNLPGFQRAVASSLSKAWAAGLSLEQEANAADGQTAQERLASLATLEREVLGQIPNNQLRPEDLVAAALKQAQHSPAIFGQIEIHGRIDIPAVWRPLFKAISKYTDIAWVAGARKVPEWLSESNISVEIRDPSLPNVQTFSCANPHHEVLEAIRWARKHLANGVSPQDIAIVAASPDSWDDHILAHKDSANLPVHFIHGQNVFSTSEGQLVAALAEVLLRGFSRTRIIRLVATLRSKTTDFETLPSNWWRALPEDAPLLDAPRWHRAFEELTVESFSYNTNHKPLLDKMINTLSKGLNAAEEIGETLLQGRALAIWRTALTEGPPAALDVTLASLRIDDGVEPETSIVWGPASTISAAPRPYTWLLGLTSRSWPRRASEDPLLPDHIIPSSHLDPLPIHHADRHYFRTIMNMTNSEIVCSRARRNSEGRLNGASPLFPRDIVEVYLPQSREPDHAASNSDRLLARPKEFGQLLQAKSALQTWIDWHKKEITAHDGKIRENHPLLLRALDRKQSATSLVKLLRDPLG